MEHNQKKSVSSILMTVGVFCILVAGSIFVTTAWKYLPEIVKQFCLLGVAGAMFAGSTYVEKKGNLKKTERALYYLGTAFVGFFVVAILGGLSGTCNSFKLMVASFVMLFPVTIRGVRKKDGFEFGAAIILLDSFLLSMLISIEAKGVIYAFMIVVLVFLHTIVNKAFYDTFKENEKMDKVLLKSYIWHIVIAFLYNIVFVVFDKEWLSVISCVLLTIAANVEYQLRKGDLYRVFHSVVLFFTVLSAINVLNYFFTLHLPVLFITFFINAIITVIYLRKDMFCIQLAIGAFAGFIQIIACWCASLSPASSAKCYPYFLVLALMLGVAGYVKDKKENIAFVWNNSYMKVAFVLMLLFANELLAARFSKYGQMGFFFLVAGYFLASSVGVISYENKGILKTLALINVQLALLGQDFINIAAYTEEGVTIYNYNTELICMIMGVGIVLLGFIWYHKSKGLRTIQFIATCFLLTSLLFSNLVNAYGIENVVFLGIVCVIILIVAALHNNKPYVMAAAITISLLVFYITIDFWLSIAWWVYLFVAGVILVLLAIKKEKEM